MVLDLGLAALVVSMAPLVGDKAQMAVQLPEAQEIQMVDTCSVVVPQVAPIQALGGWPNGGSGCHTAGVANGGGGGDGYYGGGGIYQPNGNGGGGGSNYINTNYVTTISNLSGSGCTPANNDDVNYQSGIGIGGNAASGGNGLVYISW